ncbi:collagenase-like [Helicoverpa zea]|uniref:collagenase-like n=1 Tax=Helicoverpa zea TaxID=7113 RepID=UPI001F5604C2|nr:collagenase-like [Helicoverpa zea]
MKAVVVLVCLLGLVVGEDVVARYHRQVGIPAAARMRVRESMRIAGGLNSYNGEHPYLAGLVITLKTDDTSVCSGSLLNHYYIISAAQCWYDGEAEGKEMQVVLGTSKLFSGGKRVFAQSVTLHPYYDMDTLENNIAMIQVPYISYNSYITPITLPVAYFSSLAGYKAQIMGFGKTYSGGPLDGSTSLRDVNVTVMSNSQCQETYKSLVTNDIVCSSGEGGRGACGGDQGGPLVLRRNVLANGNDLLVGVVSFMSIHGCEAGYPTGHTRVTSYLHWINSFL